MTNLFKHIDEIKNTLTESNYHRYVIQLKDGYILSCLTGSHCNSHIFQSIEVALMKDNDFAIESDDSDDSIIHYISWSLFLDFIGDMNSIINGRSNKTFEEVFIQYQKWA